MSNTVVPSRDRSVLVSVKQLETEQARGRLRTRLTIDPTLNILKVVNEVRAGRRISEGAWACVFNWFLNRLKALHPHKDWKKRLPEIDELVLLFFEHIPNYLDLDPEYYISKWSFRLGAIYLWCRLHALGYKLDDLKPRSCKIVKRTKPVKFVAGSGGIFDPANKTFIKHMYLLLQFKEDNGGKIDVDKFTDWYVTRSDSQHLKGLKATMNFRALVQRYYDAEILRRGVC